LAPPGHAAPPPPMDGMGGPVDHPKGMTILILGILSVTCCTPLGIVAFVMGNNALKEIDAQPGRYGNRQIVQLGRILGIIGMVFLVISIIWFLFLGVRWGHDVPRGSTGGTRPVPRNFQQTCTEGGAGVSLCGDAERFLGTGHVPPV
jgi:hypothetical protein